MTEPGNGGINHDGHSPIDGFAGVVEHSVHMWVVR